MIVTRFFKYKTAGFDSVSNKTVIGWHKYHFIFTWEIIKFNFNSNGFEEQLIPNDNVIKCEIQLGFEHLISKE